MRLPDFFVVILAFKRKGKMSNVCTVQHCSKHKNNIDAIVSIQFTYCFHKIDLKDLSYHTTTVQHNWCDWKTLFFIERMKCKGIQIKTLFY